MDAYARFIALVAAKQTLLRWPRPNSMKKRGISRSDAKKGFERRNSLMLHIIATCVRE
jgi:hypothetical protein